MGKPEINRHLTMKKHTKRKGLTLVELLIVIILIVILSARMMITSREGAVSALAAEILSDFESIKTAATAYYIDHSREIEKTDWSGFDTSGKDATEILEKYLTNTSLAERKKAVGEKNKYLLAGKYGTDWYVWCNVANGDVMDRLKVRGKNIDLREPDGGDFTKSKALTSSAGYVGIYIIKRDINNNKK